MARPSAEESRRRTVAFLEQVAQGVPGDAAAKWAGVKLERALRMACHPEFPLVVTAIRMGMDPDELALSEVEERAA